MKYYSNVIKPVEIVKVNNNIYDNFSIIALYYEKSKENTKK